MPDRIAPRVRIVGALRTAPAAFGSAVRTHWQSFVGLVALLTVGGVGLGLFALAGILDLPFIVRRWDSLWGPTWLAVSLTTTAFLLGFATALPLGLARAYLPGRFRKTGRAKEFVPFRRARDLWGTPRAIRVTAARRTRSGLNAAAYGLATGYVEGVRGTPFYVQMFLVFYLILGVYRSFPGWFQGGMVFLFNTLGYPPVPEEFYFAGLLTLFLNTAGYQAEVLRGGFQSVGQGQIEAARSVGMRGRQIFRRITFPQALRLVILPLTNEWISLFKACAILSTWPILEILLQSQQLGVNEGHPLEAFIMLAAMYLLVDVTLGKTVTYVERKTRIPGLGTPGLRTGTAGRPGRRRAPTL